MNRTAYTYQLDGILSDPKYFTIETRNPQLKTEVNKLIKSVNDQSKTRVLQPKVGEYTEGYIYDTVKIHKEGNLVTPIIPQVSTPVYKAAKVLIP